MTYRERRMAKADRLRGWADKRQTDAARVFKSGEPFRSDNAFNTQPGHIPFRSRLIAREHKAYESLNKAASMDSKASEIERQADNAIYSDDPDAIEQLTEKIARLESERARIKACNAAIRKHGLPALAKPDAPFTLSGAEKTELLTLMRITPYHHVETKGFPAYQSANLSGNLSRLRKRLLLMQREKELA